MYSMLDYHTPHLPHLRLSTMLHHNSTTQCCTTIPKQLLYWLSFCSDGYSDQASMTALAAYQVLMTRSRSSSRNTLAGRADEGAGAGCASTGARCQAPRKLTQPLLGTMVREGLLLATIACPRPFQEGLVPAMLAGCGLACLYLSCAPHVHYSTIWYAKVPSLVSATCKPHNLQRDCAWVILCARVPGMLA